MNPGLSRNCHRGANLHDATARTGWKAEGSADPGARTPPGADTTRMEDAMATARPLAIIDELLATVDYLRISVGDLAMTAGCACRSLVADPAALAAVVGRHEGGSGAPTATTWRPRCSSRATRSASPPSRSARGCWPAPCSTSSPGNDVDRPRSRPPNAVNLAVADGGDVRRRRRRPRRAHRRPPRPARRHRPRDVPRRRRPAVGQRGGVVRGVVRRLRRRAAVVVGSRSATGPRSSSPPLDPRSATPVASCASATASHGNGAAAACGTAPNRRGMCEDCSLRRPRLRPARRWPACPVDTPSNEGVPDART